MRKRVRTLLRVSSRQQLHDDDIPVQREEAAQYIRTHSDWEFDFEYMEKAVSAYKNSVEKREVLQQILADARAHQFEVLLTYMSDRIGRQEEYSFYVAALNQLGIEVWTIKDGQLKTQEHVDKLLNYIRFWQNEGESKKTGMRVRDSQKEMVKSGKFVGGKAPYGYHLVSSGGISNHGRLLKKLEIVPTEAEVVRRIYSLAIREGMGYERIAKTLNGEGIPAITTTKWKAGTISGILKNPIYMGYIAYGRRSNQGTLTRQSRENWIYSDEQITELVIVSKREWERAQEIREARKRKIQTAKIQSSEQYQEQYKIPFSTKGRLALSGLVYCGYCGKRLKNGSYCNQWKVKATGERKVSFAGRYVCQTGCKERNCYSQKYLESIVFEVVQEYLHQMKPLDISEELLKLQRQEMEEIATEIQQLERSLHRIRLDIDTLEEKIPEAMRGEYCFQPEKLAELIGEKIDKQNKLMERADFFRGKKLKIEKQMEDIRVTVKNKVDCDVVFMDAEPSEKQMILARMLERIVVLENEVHIRFHMSQENFQLLKSGGFGVPESGV